MMPILRCYVDERTLDILTEYGRRNGRSVEELAEAAISDAAVHAIPPHLRSPMPPPPPPPRQIEKNG